MTAFQAVDTGSIPVMGSENLVEWNLSYKEDFIMPDNKQLVLDGFGESAYIRWHRVRLLGAVFMPSSSNGRTTAL